MPEPGAAFPWVALLASINPPNSNLRQPRKVGPAESEAEPQASEANGRARISLAWTLKQPGPETGRRAEAPQKCRSPTLRFGWRDQGTRQVTCPVTITVSKARPFPAAGADT